MNNDNTGYVYVVSNPAMTGLVKIGITQSDDFAKRLNDLYTTSVPYPFVCEYACKVEDCRKVEKALQIAFKPHRKNPRREFFEITPDQVIPILKLLEIEDATQAASEILNNDSDMVERKSGDEYKKKKRPNLNFFEMGIQEDSIITFEENGRIVEARVLNERKVFCNEKEYFLTPLTKELLEIDYAVQPTGYWYYQGKSLHDIYDETYNAIE